MSDPFATAEDAFEQGIGAVANAVKQQVATTTAATASQLGGSDKQAAPDAPRSDVSTNPTSPQDDPAKALTPQQVEQMDGQKKVENEGKLQETRKKLHDIQELHKKNYFDPTFNPPKKEQPVADKLEKEKQQEEQIKLQELEEKKKKDEPIALARAKRTTESNRGAGG